MRTKFLFAVYFPSSFWCWRDRWLLYMDAHQAKAFLFFLFIFWQWHAHSAVMDKHTSCKFKFARQMSPWLHSTNAATLIVPSTGKKADSAAFRNHKPFLVCNAFTLHGMSVQSTWNHIFTQRHGDFTCTLQFGWHLWSVQFYPYDDAMTGSAKHIRSGIWMC
jgi:hypothetical protein